MGTVYKAVQEHPRRTVAIKLMRRGIASRSALRRFEYESQLLGRLRHPGIAQVYEAGTHDDGGEAVPFFAVEYIPNAKPITEYAKQKKLSTRERLELFSQVCDAVHHGHQKGIIHRDLKPSNILIDSSGQPRIIDFGVARSTDSDMAVTTLQTDVGQLLGTLQYMSPEQCEADPHDIDTRSDVYALGVVLYELLCEQLPYDVRQMAIHEATRVIREQQPTKLSTINRRLRGDVETIALNAIEKERDRRYRSAAEFGDDIQRYLNSDPIIARKNKALFTATAAVFMVLVAVVVVSTSLYWEADSARRQAIEARNQAEQSRKAEAEQRHLVEAERNRALAAEVQQSRERERAEQARAEAERQVAIAKAVNDFLNDDLLAAVAPEEQGREVTVREVLDTASKAIEGKFEDEPLIEASIRMTLGNTYYSLGEYKTAEPHLNRAVKLRRAELGEEDPETLTSMDYLGFLYSAQGRYDDSEPLLVRTLELRRRVLGEEHIDVAESMINLANALASKGDYGAAEPLQREALAMRRRLVGDEHTLVAESLNNLAVLLMNKGDYDAAEPLFRESLAMARRLLGEEHPHVATSLGHLGALLRDKGELEEAEAMLREDLEKERAAVGDEHWYTGNSRSQLGARLTKMGRYEEAEQELLEAHRVLKTALGSEHKRTIKTVNFLVDLYDAWSKPDKAAAWRAKLSVSDKATDEPSGRVRRVNSEQRSPRETPSVHSVAARRCALHP